MNKIRLKYQAFLLGCLLILFIYPSYAENSSPVGFWRTVDDHTHKPAGVVQIWQQNGVIYGKILEIFLQDGDKPADRCIKCPEPFYNKPILGMTIMWGFKQDEDMWKQGHILDPKIGTIYRCQLKLSNNDTQLNVHGYIGIPLIGRTQTWQRLENYQPKN